jgi:hypothetical protein
MLDFLGTIAITAAMVVVINAVVSTLNVGRPVRLVLATLVGVWIGLVVALASIGELADAGRRPVPMIGILFAAPLVLAALGAIAWPTFRNALLALPMPLLIGLNAARVFGGFFVLLAVDGRLSGPFPYSAGWGDVITGVLALPVAWLALRASAGRDRIVGAWNAFGALDLVVAVFLGVTSTSGAALQLMEVGPGSAAMQHLPWALVPTVLVPAYLILHAVIFAQLWARNRSFGAAGHPVTGPA